MQMVSLFIHSNGDSDAVFSACFSDWAWAKHKLLAQDSRVNSYTNHMLRKILMW